MSSLTVCVCVCVCVLVVVPGQWTGQKVHWEFLSSAHCFLYWPYFWLCSLSDTKNISLRYASQTPLSDYLARRWRTREGKRALKFTDFRHSVTLFCRCTFLCFFLSLRLSVSATLAIIQSISARKRKAVCVCVSVSPTRSGTHFYTDIHTYTLIRAHPVSTFRRI